MDSEKLMQVTKEYVENFVSEILKIIDRLRDAISQIVEVMKDLPPESSLSYANKPRYKFVREIGKPHRPIMRVQYRARSNC